MTGALAPWLFEYLLHVQRKARQYFRVFETILVPESGGCSIRLADDDHAGFRIYDPHPEGARLEVLACFVAHFLRAVGGRQHFDRNVRRASHAAMECVLRIEWLE